MSALLSVSLEGLPGSVRPRVTRGGTHTHMPRAYVEWREAAERVLREAWGGRLAAPGLVEAVVVIVVRVPSASVPVGGLPRRQDAGKPDVDNAAKGALDALVAAGVLVDDSQVVRLVAERWRGAVEPRPTTMRRHGESQEDWRARRSVAYARERRERSHLEVTLLPVGGAA